MPFFFFMPCWRPYGGFLTNFAVHWASEPARSEPRQPTVTHTPIHLLTRNSTLVGMELEASQLRTLCYLTGHIRASIVQVRQCGTYIQTSCLIPL